MNWPRSIPLPDPKLVADYTLNLCGEDVSGGAVAAKVVAVIGYNLYCAPGRPWAAHSYAYASGFGKETLRSAYKRAGDRKYVRVLASVVVGALIENAERGLRGEPSISTDDIDYASITRKALKGHAGGAV